jgi:hypothetical protein
MSNETNDSPRTVLDDWTDTDWDATLLAIRYKQCTPFLGAGACDGTLPLGKEIALKWADEYDYPFADRDNLVRVAQYLAVEKGANTPKYRMVDALAGKGPPDFSRRDEPHSVVADLDLPVYITTNYDDFMLQALKQRKPPKDPRREVCKWHLARRRQLRATDFPNTPTAEQPVIFHLHGTLDDIASMVLTEDDYLDFLMYVSELPELIPPRIEQAFAESSLLFIGYSLEDLNFKVFFRKLASYMQRNEGARHVAVQIAPRHNESAGEQLERAAKQRRYLEKTFGLQKVKVYWGTANQFAGELRTRWEAFKRERNS